MTVMKNGFTFLQRINDLICIQILFIAILEDQ